MQGEDVRLRGRRGYTYLVLGLTLSCARTDRDSPHIDAVQPAVIQYGVAQPLIISGANFYAGAEVGLSSRDAVKIQNNFRVLIDNTPLSADAISAESSHRLDVRCPPTLSPGPHTVTVVTPEGLTDTLENAFTVEQVPGFPPGGGGAFGMGGAPSALGGGANAASGGAGNMSGSLGGAPTNFGGAVGVTTGGMGGMGSSSGGGGSSSAGGAPGTGGAGMGGAASMTTGGTGSTGSGGAPALINGCNAFDPLSGKCIHTCSIDGNGTIDYCRLIFFANIADCVYTTNPNPNNCETQAGSGELEVGLNRPSVGSAAHAYYRFEVNHTLPPGSTIDGLYFFVNSTMHALAPSNSTGELWFSEAFNRDDLFSKLPLKIGGSPIGQDLGMIGTYQERGWTLSRSAFALPSTVFMTVVPKSTDSVHYFNVDDPNERPYLQVDYR